MMITPFNKPHMTGKELSYIAEANFKGMLAGDGHFTARCHQWLEKNTEHCSPIPAPQPWK